MLFKCEWEKMRHTFVRFLLVGATNTLFSYLLYLLLLTFVSYLPAYSIAYCAGVLLSYFLNVLFVFKKRVSFATFLKFPLVYVVQYALGASILWLLVSKAGASPALAMIVVIVVTIPVTFFLSRLVFEPRSRS